MGYKIINALKKLYTKLGGTATDVENVNQTSEMINAIAGLNMSGGGSTLPTVTKADEGSALIVKNGVWDKGKAGGELFPVTFEMETGEPDEDGNIAIKAVDKTVDEVIAAFDAGKNIVAHFDIDGNQIYLPLSGIDTFADDGTKVTLISFATQFENERISAEMQAAEGGETYAKLYVESTGENDVYIIPVQYTVKGEGPEITSSKSNYQDALAAIRANKTLFAKVTKTYDFSGDGGPNVPDQPDEYYQFGFTKAVDNEQILFGSEELGVTISTGDIVSIEGI